ncbi:unnamed protein product [Calicophoron daubneyi]|uniref:Uncharacterized protein n=1 Tax=Calicophoron daubneyi TaxID=300641 RepID=A0AAV2U128_CALDB
MAGVTRPLRISRWTVAGFFALTLIYLAVQAFPQWNDNLAFYPKEPLNSIKRLSFLTFWLVTNEHVTHWLAMLSLFILDKLVHDCWSQLETLAFISFVNLSALALSATTMAFLPVDPFASLYGNAALISAATVVSTQLDPDRFLLGYGRVGLKSRHGFFCGLLLILGAALVSLVRWSSVLLYINGFIGGWFYLRFLQHHPQRKYGDHRASFAFAKFFPGPLEKWVAIPTNLIYFMLLRSKLCPSLERQSEIVSTASFAVNIPGLTSDADRHRRIALKALNERLFSKPDRSEVTEWPNLEEPDSEPSPPSKETLSGDAQSVKVDLTAQLPPASEPSSSPTPAVDVKS